MTLHDTKSLRILAVMSLLAASPAIAEPGPDAITLERIGAVRMAAPDEVRQQPTSAQARPAQEQHRS